MSGHTRGYAYRRRIGGAMLLAGGVLALLTTVIPHPVPGGGDAPIVAVALVALLLGGLLVARPESFPQSATPWFVAFGTVLVTLAARTAGVTGTHGADNEVLYLIVVLYAFYFLSTWVAVVELALIGLAYGALLLEAVPFDVAVTRWGVTVGTLSVAGLLVRHLNLRVDSLISELDAGARRDPLTGILNRRGLDERLGIEITRARRTGEPLCVLTADLDGLKQINDRYGHAAGDEALGLAAEVMAGGLRDVDVLARTGGDEFVLLLPNCGTGAGFTIAEQLLEGMRMRSSTESWPTTVSVGVAGAPPLPLDPDALVAAADRALYRAKALGRNRASMAGSAEVRRVLDGQ